MRQHANPRNYRWRVHIASPGLRDHGMRALDSWCASRPFHDVAMWPGQDGCTLVVTGDAPHVESVVWEVCALLSKYALQVQHGRLHCIGYGK